MHILINASNLKAGGGMQVADSLCGLLGDFPQHEFVVVLSRALRATAGRVGSLPNVRVVEHDVRNDWRTLVLGRDRVMDGLVSRHGIEVVLTVFGPSRWVPKCLHISGFARPQLVLRDSPFYTRRRPAKERLADVAACRLLLFYFKRCAQVYYTENPYITERLSALMPEKRVYTVTNYYNQAYDHPEQWRRRELPPFEGTTLLTVTAMYPHKNLPMAIDVARVLRREHPEFAFRFVMTIDRAEFPPFEEELARHFVFTGRVDITECPSLYEQADVMFQPTLLECFSATYPEAMKMRRPIVTTDIEFARGLCGAAARYYSPLSAEDAARAIYEVATDAALRSRLVEAGREQLGRFDTYTERAHKLIGIVEQEAARRRGR